MHSPASASSAAYHVQLLSTVKAVTMISQIAKSCQAPQSLIDAFTSHKTDQHIRVINWANGLTSLTSLAFSSTMKSLLHDNVNRLTEVSF